MNDDENTIPDRTLEAFARGFFSEASLYGFKQTDYIRFVNHLLDIAIAMKNGLKAKSDKTSDLKSQTITYVNQLPLIGDKVTIRALDLNTDLVLLKQWFESDSGRLFFLSCSEPIIQDCEACLSNPQNHFGIISLKSGQVIGAIGYLNHDQTQCRAELRKLIADPKVHGQGIEKEAAQLWLNYGMLGLGLKKIFLTTLDTNTRNIRLNEVLGFKVEGILRNEVMLDGRYRDILRMGLWVCGGEH